MFKILLFIFVHVLILGSCNQNDRSKDITYQEFKARNYLDKINNYVTVQTKNDGCYTGRFESIRVPKYIVLENKDKSYETIPLEDIVSIENFFIDSTEDSIKTINTNNNKKDNKLDEKVETNELTNFDIDDRELKFQKIVESNSADLQSVLALIAYK